MGARMGLPAEWDVVERMAGTEGALLKKALLGFRGHSNVTPTGQGSGQAVEPPIKLPAVA